VLKRYQVENRFTDRVFGLYHAETEDDALDQCARDQGYADFADALGRVHADITDTAWVARELPATLPARPGPDKTEETDETDETHW
jgi:hypothetical protein